MSNAETREFVRGLVQGEFRAALTATEHEVPICTDAVVVLSGPPVRDDTGEIISEKSPENFARISFGIQIAKEIASARSDIPFDLITPDHVLEYAPMMVLNGETEQIPAMVELAVENGFPLDHMLNVDCGVRGVGNTKTQFEAMNEEPYISNLREITIVTSAYHAPRTARTAEANLKNGINFKVIPVPYDCQEEVSFNLVLTVLGEVKRIIKYSNKGDISRYL